MLVLAPLRSRFAIAVVLWLSILLLIWHHGASLQFGPWKHQPGPSAPEQSPAQPQTSQPDNQTGAKSEPKRPSPPPPAPKKPPAAAASAEIEQLLSSISKTTSYFVNDPLPPSHFNKMGERLQILGSWIEAREALSRTLTTGQKEKLVDQIERTTISLLPFVRNPSLPKETRPFDNLRRSFKKGSRGIVIASNKKSFRFACHAIHNIRNVLKSDLPIEVVHGGENDLPPSYRKFVVGLGTNITTVEAKKIVDDKHLELEKSLPAVKPFAALVSSFEQVILVDAESVFLQKPEAILDAHTGYKSTGALFFHDHLYGKGDKKERHAWWRKCLSYYDPSSTLSRCRAFNQGFAEEADSGLVIIDKSRLSTLLGLLHACWQSMRRVRAEWTYVMNDGDKDIWWFGFELTRTKFTWENHYAGVVGWADQDAEHINHTKVVGSTTAHTDESDKLLWYSGTLLVNKAVNATLYEAPTHWMVDGDWQGPVEGGQASIVGNDAIDLTPDEQKVLRESIEGAEQLNVRLQKFTLN
ncbi:MAG: hypothetical protein LQ342_001484 [Letrouitia transgressa]|nr:MAG: hypothetical protein LQ342_001484 [Letrouitia transgressa]